tara:strand:+ start:1712 stop:3328 length:1617 start_codon:yes stop_codon:yes gene_type:complete
MKKIVFVSDFFADQVQGGAEIYDALLVQQLESKGVKVCKFNSHEFTDKHFKLYEKTGFMFLVSNFVNLSESVKKLMQIYSDRYCILEHDHKYLKNRNPADFKNFKAPREMIINQEFYRSAKQVFCQSVKHAEVLSLNLGIDNVTNLGCSLWSKEQLELISSKICEKNSKAAIINDPNVIKGTKEAVAVCESKNIDYDLLPKAGYEDYLSTLAKYETFVFFPKTLESFCRVLLEARMMGCKLVTNNLNGCTYEPWFRGLKGQDLIDYVDSQRDVVVTKIYDKVFETTNEESKDGDITVILNCYRRPYNLKMQVDAIRAQSVKPVQIWLWINYHEDNKDFDPSTLGVDKVFSNDFNWKFYGRFAAALLADTEYIAIYDDDTIPGKRWHENCLKTMKTHEGILGSAGIILKSDRYVNHDRCGWPTQNREVTEVDLVGHSWFFKREWLRYLWQEKPVTWENGEDIQFGFMAKVYGGIPTYCPPHPPEDRELHGSILGNELGIDDKATSTNSSVSHQQFFSERDRCVQEGIKSGWKTVRGISL